MRTLTVWGAMLLFFAGCGWLFRAELRGISDERLALMKQIETLSKEAASFRTVLQRKEQEEVTRHLEMIANLRVLATPEQQTTLDIIRRLKALEEKL